MSGSLALLIDVHKQVSWLHPKRVGDSHDVEQTHVPFAAFDTADISAVQPADVRKSLLRELP